MSGMEITGVLVEKIGQKFKPHLSTSESKVAVNAGCALIRTWLGPHWCVHVQHCAPCKHVCLEHFDSVGCDN